MKDKTNFFMEIVFPNSFLCKEGGNQVCAQREEKYG